MFWVSPSSSNSKILKHWLPWALSCWLWWNASTEELSFLFWIPNQDSMVTGWFMYLRTLKMFHCYSFPGHFSYHLGSAWCFSGICHFPSHLWNTKHMSRVWNQKTENLGTIDYRKIPVVRYLGAISPKGVAPAIFGVEKYPPVIATTPPTMSPKNWKCKGSKGRRLLQRNCCLLVEYYVYPQSTDAC